MRRDKSAMGVFLAVAALVGAYHLGRARADGVPTVTPLFYGGMLEDNGRPVEGRRDLTIRLWDAATGGATACTTAVVNVEFAAGRFRVPLDASCAGAVRSNPNLWAEVQIGGTTFPRSKLGAVPYALEAGRASGAAGALETRLAALEGRPTARFFLRGPLPRLDAENQPIRVPVTCPPIPMGQVQVITDFGQPETSFEFSVPVRGAYSVSAPGLRVLGTSGDAASVRCELQGVVNGLSAIVELPEGRYQVRCTFRLGESACAAGNLSYLYSSPCVVSGW